MFIRNNMRDSRRLKAAVEWWLSGGIILPIFDIIGGALQHLFSSTKMKTVVKSDGFTYVKDEANKGTDRIQETGKSMTFDGVDGKIVVGNVGNTKYSYGWVKQVVDNQILFSLADTTATAVSVVAGVLTFGTSITVSNIYVDGVSKTAAEAGVILNDNLVHQLYVEYTQIATSNLVLAYNGTTYGNVELFDFRVGDTVEVLADVIIVYDNPNTLFDTETGMWHLDEGAGLTAFDSSGNGNNGTISGGVTNTTQDVVSFQNYYGYNKPASVYIPAKLDSETPTVDVLDNTLTNSGKAPKDGRLVESHCATFDGVGDKINIADLVGTETVTSSGGTSTPTIVAGSITFSAGTCWDLQLSNGSQYPLSEGAGLIAFDIINNFNGTIIGTEASIWASTQDIYHNNLLNGFDYESAYFDGSSHIEIGSTDIIGIGEILEIRTLYTGATDYLLKLKAATNDYIRINSVGQINIRSNNATTTASIFLSKKNIWVKILVERETSTNYIISVYNLYDNTLLGQDITNIISTAFSIDKISYAIGDARKTIIRSVGISDKHLWSQANNWIDEKGSDDGTIMGTIKLPKIPSTLYPATSNPSGKYHNNAETKFKPNPLGAPELIYRAGLEDTVTRHPSDIFTRPEFINKNDLDKSKEYVVYDKNISIGEGDSVDTAIGN